MKVQIGPLRPKKDSPDLLSYTWQSRILSIRVVVEFSSSFPPFDEDLSGIPIEYSSICSSGLFLQWLHFSRHDSLYAPLGLDSCHNMPSSQRTG